MSEYFSQINLAYTNHGNTMVLKEKMPLFWLQKPLI